MRSRTITRIMGLGIATAGLLLCGCSIIHPWKVPTTYEFVGLRPSESVHIENVFRKRGLTYSVVEKEPPTYEVTGVRTAKDFAGLQAALSKAIDSNGLEVQFREAHLSYSGLSGGGEVSTTISLTITPADSVVHIADGQGKDPWRLIEVDKRGKWSGPVNTAGVVADTGGWVYVFSRRGSLERVFRVNVLRKTQERWLGNLPFAKPPKQ